VPRRKALRDSSFVTTVTFRARVGFGTITYPPDGYGGRGPHRRRVYAQVSHHVPRGRSGSDRTRGRAGQLAPRQGNAPTRERVGGLRLRESGGDAPGRNEHRRARDRSDAGRQLPL